MDVHYKYYTGVCCKFLKIIVSDVIKITAFWDVGPCSLVEADRRPVLRTAFIIRATTDVSIIKAITDDEGSANL
jgi:hypothetical protein